MIKKKNIMLHKNILIKSVSFESEGYDQAKKIRQQYLRNPLGLVFTSEDLEIDRSACHVIAYDGIDIRQMLVIPEYQKKINTPNSLFLIKQLRLLFLQILPQLQLIVRRFHAFLNQLKLGINQSHY